MLKGCPSKMRFQTIELFSIIIFVYRYRIYKNIDIGVSDKLLFSVFSLYITDVCDYYRL